MSTDLIIASAESVYCNSWHSIARIMNLFFMLANRIR